MPIRVALVSCVKQKCDRAAPAQDLYLSQLFLGLRRYAKKHADVWYILSAEHGVLRPDEVVEPYERTLNKMPKRERVAWAQRVQRQLLEILPAGADVILLAGLRYREDLEPFLRNRGFSVSVPLEGLKIGKQLQRLKDEAKMTRSVCGDVDRFYSLLKRLADVPGQGRPLRELPPRSMLPERGVYFFLEPGELRTASPSVQRVVRVGTHAVSFGSKATLRKRLKAHLGTRTGGGNHRGSVFRLHVGTALLARDETPVTTWGVGSAAPPEFRNSETIRAAEAACEQRVSEYIGAMPVLWVNIPDEAGPESERAFIEQNAIALLSNQFVPIDSASEKWLGRFSPRQEIRDSALWNLNYVTNAADPLFLDKLESFVAHSRSKARC